MMLISNVGRKTLHKQNGDQRLFTRRLCNQCRSRASTAVLFLAWVGLQLHSMHEPALAATEVRGQPDAIQLVAENASIKDILDALAASYKLTYKLPPNLRSELTDHYSGTLRQILERILDGNDYILKVFDDSIDVVVLGASGAVAVASSGPEVTAGNDTKVPSATGSAPASGPVLPSPSTAPPLASYLSQGPAASNTP
jgi:hypothetical protein